MSRRSMPAKSRRRADLAIAATAAALAQGSAVVSAYAPMPGEPGGPGLPDALAAAGREVLLPIVLPDLDLDWAIHRDRGGLAVPAAGRGPREPDGPRLGPAAVNRAEIVFVPALAVDRTGVRLGRGGGSFDRALARVRPGTPVVALLYQGEVRDRLPAEPHDRPVTAVITQAGLLYLRTAGAHPD